MLPNTITVTVPVQEWNENRFHDTRNCYIATELKKLGHKNVSVGGITMNVEDEVYKISSTNDQYGTIKDALENNLPITVTLIKCKQ